MQTLEVLALSFGSMDFSLITLFQSNRLIEMIVLSF